MINCALSQPNNALASVPYRCCAVSCQLCGSYRFRFRIMLKRDTEKKYVDIMVNTMNRMMAGICVTNETAEAAIVVMLSVKCPLRLCMIEAKFSVEMMGN